MSAAEVALSLGSNLGDRRANLAAALRALDDELLEGMEVSGVYETAPVEVGEAQPAFWNCCAVGRATLAPADLRTTVDAATLGLETTADLEVRMLPVRVHAVDHLSHDVVRMQLKLPENQRLQFMAGQYLDFLLPDGRKRAFSIANAPHDDEFIELHIRHVDGGEFTDWVFNKMHERAILRIQAPLGSFVLDEESDRPMIFMGGGTGFAPLKGQIEQAFRAKLKQPIHLYWGVRSKRDLYLPDLPEQWVRAHANFSFVPVLSEPDEDWQGRTGWVHEAVMADFPDLSTYDLYMAGPPPMVNAGRDAFRAAGMPDAHMHYDSFEYAEDTRDKVGD